MLIAHHDIRIFWSERETGSKQRRKKRRIHENYVVLPKLPEANFILINVIQQFL
ncbi:hypothetical protein DPMN_165184 [Dreissena polymorpha]|uniref:Uncharacterized protein n=1 Tax=Dreissena polymorpha TaxID=45954 RepID=A0A9D4EZU1_DREPO|nr:hypothetical protein DPMN_165184 [Dreissena polymorpha]